MQVPLNERMCRKERTQNIDVRLGKGISRPAGWLNLCVCGVVGG